MSKVHVRRNEGIKDYVVDFSNGYIAGEYCLIEKKPGQPLCIFFTNT